MWQKVSLEAAGKLASGYPGIGRGFDAVTCASRGLEEQAVKDYIKKNKPTYPQFEAWVKANSKSLTPQAIEKHNADRKSTRLNSSHVEISYAVFCLKKKKQFSIY